MRLQFFCRLSSAQDYSVGCGGDGYFRTTLRHTAPEKKKRFLAEENGYL